VDASLGAKPSCAEPAIATPRLWIAAPRRPESEGSVMFTLIVFLGTVMIACIVALAVDPSFFGRDLLTRRLPVRAERPRARTLRSA
jgi:hypothetical protein